MQRDPSAARAPLQNRSDVRLPSRPASLSAGFSARGLFRTEYAGQTLRDHYGIREADQAYARNDVIRGVEAVRRLRQ
jgi:hypothetical protein